MRLHKEFGLNPTMPVCIICGEDTGEIALLGASYKEQAPMKMVMGIIPCDKCKEKYLKKGVMLVEAKQEATGIHNTKTTPTGKFIVLKDLAFKKIFNKPIPKGKICYVEEGILDGLQARIKGRELK